MLYRGILQAIYVNRLYGGHTACFICTRYKYIVFVYLKKWENLKQKGLKNKAPCCIIYSERELKRNSSCALSRK